MDKGFFALKISKSVLIKVFAKFFDKSDFLNLVKIDILDLTKFAIVDQFLIYLLVSPSPILLLVSLVIIGV